MKMESAKSFEVDKSMRGLGYALRHPETWPPGFEFNYQHTDKCAIGLAYRLRMIDEPNMQAMMAAFGLSFHQTFTMFCSGYDVKKGQIMRKDQVTPEMVADRIDAYLERQAGGPGASGGEKNAILKQDAQKSAQKA